MKSKRDDDTTMAHSICLMAGRQIEDKIHSSKPGNNEKTKSYEYVYEQAAFG